MISKKYFLPNNAVVFSKIKKIKWNRCAFFLHLTQIITMNHNVKTLVFKCLDMLPSRLGYKVYHQLQNLSENKDVDLKIKSTESTFHEFVKITEELKIAIGQKSVIEIGSGWLPIFPYFLLFVGKVRNVFSFDLNEHYQKKSIASFNSLFSKNYKVSIAIPSDSKYNLPEGLHYFPRQNIIDTVLPDCEIVFSRFVLEHVTPRDILEMHR